MKKLLLSTIILFLFTLNLLTAQSSECPYPIIFIHGWTGNQSSFSPVYNDVDFINVWGGLADVHHSVLNTNTQSHIWGVDGIPENEDDDVLVEFINETNDLAAGCLYAINFENFWNEDNNNPNILQNSGNTPSLFDSDSNEASILKQGYALGKAIEKVLLANPQKEKVILIGHSMGGLSAREYLQRRIPETPTGTPRWWVDPNNPDGHKVAKLITTTTPNLGSNLFGNSSFDEKKNETEDAIQDLASEAVRDLRYSYACGFLNLSDCPGVYLYGGDEDDFSVFPFPYWSEDVDCDGDETSPSVVGINIDGILQGVGDTWDGTYDNPQLPLPTNVRYTWITSDIPAFFGDGVVSLNRQWLYDGATPKPSDGTPHRLSDSLLTDYSHITVTNDVNTIVRAMDEGDYPLFAWRIQLNTVYAGLPQLRSVNVPEAPNNKDPDWYQFVFPQDIQEDILISLIPNANRSGRLDFYNNVPTDYENMTSVGSQQAIFSIGSGAVDVLVPFDSLVADQTYYLRVIHEGVHATDWGNPFQLSINSICAATLTVSDLVVDEEQDLQAVDSIISTSIITDTSEVTYTAGELIVLKNGFIAEEGSGFLAQIGACVPTQLEQDIISNEFQSTIKSTSFLSLEKEDNRKLKVYPNPVDDLLYLSGEISNCEIELYNAMGKRVAFNKQQLSNETINFKGHPSGVYYLQIKRKDNQSVQVEKIIKL